MEVCESRGVGGAQMISRDCGTREALAPLTTGGAAGLATHLHHSASPGGRWLRACGERGAVSVSALAFARSSSPIHRRMRATARRVHGVTAARATFAGHSVPGIEDRRARGVRRALRARPVRPVLRASAVCLVGRAACRLTIMRVCEGSGRANVYVQRPFPSSRRQFSTASRPPFR